MMKTIAITCHLWHNIAMEFVKLLEIVGDKPIFETGLLLAGDVNPADVRRQLSRWVKAGRLQQLRRGIYTLASPYQKVKPHPFVVANALVRGSYVSLQSVLAHYGFIPDIVKIITSVTTGRPARWETPLGTYEFRHVKKERFYGYQKMELETGQYAFVATPEKALLDLIHFEPGGDNILYLDSLRLQALDGLDLRHLMQLAERSGSAKLMRGAQEIVGLAQHQSVEYESL
jgi:predicted transcriptional regulator of viral defense system